MEFADFSRLPTRCRFIAFMPQWEFLDFLAGEARQVPRFRLLMRTEATGLLRDGCRVSPASPPTAPDGPLEIRAELVVGLRRPALHRCARRPGCR